MTSTHPDPFVAAIMRDMAPMFVEPDLPEPPPAAAGGRRMAMSLVFDTPDETAAWLASRHKPEWKHRVPAPAKKLTLKRPLKSELAADAETYEYRVNFDYRKHTTPAATLEEFIARNSDPKWKPKALPKPRGLKSLSTKDRAAEERRVATYVASRRAA